MKKYVVRLEENSKKDFPFSKEYRFNTIEEAKTCFAEKVETDKFCYQDNDVFEKYKIITDSPTEFKVVNIEEPNEEYYYWTLSEEEKDKIEKIKENKEEEFTMAKRMKIEVTQVPPEAQESYWMLDGEPDNIVLFGNKDYSEHWGKWGDISRDYENCIDSFNEDFTSKGEPIEEGFFTSLEELTEYYLSPYGYKYRPEDEETWKSLFLNDDCYNKEVWVPVVLNLIERKPYRFSVLRGDCQSDWQYIVFSPDDYPSENAIREMEAEYFNTGSEWHVELIEDEQLLDSFNFYSEKYLDTKEEILKAVQEQVGNIANATYKISVCTGHRTEPVFETL